MIAKEANKVGWILITLGVVLTIIICYLSFVVALAETNNNEIIPDSQRIGYLVGSIFSPILLSAIVIGLFQIGKRFRNSKSRLIIYCCCMALFFLSSVNQFVQLVSRSL